MGQWQASVGQSPACGGTRINLPQGEQTQRKDRDSTRPTGGMHTAAHATRPLSTPHTVEVLSRCGVVSLALMTNRIFDSMAASLAKFKQPRKLVVVDALPRNAMGKVQKNILRDNYGSAGSA